MRNFTVTARARSSVAFRAGDALGMDYNLGGSVLHLEMHTRRKGPNGEFLGDLQVTALADADSVEEAAALVTRGREMAIMVSLATNCSIAPLEPELVYETTPGIEEREYFQRFVPEDQLSYANRIVPLDATASLLSAIAQHEERNRIIRAISQYSEALQLWENGNELLALSHLFMGVEAIKKAVWRREIASRNITKIDLASEWGYETKGRLGLDQFLDNCARLKCVFQNDALHHRIAKEVSDSFEHGFANGGDLFKLAASAIVPTARYLRETILGIADLPAKHRETLLSEPYAKPQGPAGLEQYFRAKLVAPAGHKLSAAGQDHPFCVWHIEIESQQTDKGSHEYTHNPTLTAVLGPGVTLVPLHNEVWAKGTFSPPTAFPSDKTTFENDT